MPKKPTRILLTVGEVAADDAIDIARAVILETNALVVFLLVLAGPRLEFFCSW
jgi:hypothetical protein